MEYIVRFRKKHKGLVDTKRVKIQATTSNKARTAARRKFGKIFIISAIQAN
jgi:hypothetical protein